MCLLLVLRGYFPEHPLLIGGNRDESTTRKAAPPGRFDGEQRRILSPRDRVAGGTWLAINDRGEFAGLTNKKDTATLAEAPSRGHLPHLALDRESLEAGLAAVEELVTATPHSGFQLVVANAERIVVLQNGSAGLVRTEWQEPILLVTNEHGPGELTPRRYSRATRREPEVDLQLDAMAHLLADRGGAGEHEVSKHGERYATVSSSLIAVPATDPTDLLWRYAPGPPDVTRYRNYGNLGRRLLPDGSR